MRIFFIILFFSLQANAATYYVSNTGSDAANGLTEGTAWQTISKVNSFVFSPGDFILFKKGDSWNEKLIVSQSGTLGNVITYGAYGTGNKPTLTGLQSISLTNVGNIWSGTATNSVPVQNTISINGSLRAKGRYPNNNYLPVLSATLSRIVGISIPDYTGTEVVSRTHRWIIDINKVISQSGDTMNFGYSQTYASSYGFFVQNKAEFLDTLNEWSYDSTSKLLSVYHTSSPVVLFSNLDTVVRFSNRQYITFDGLKLEGGNLFTMYADYTKGITVQNCTIDKSGGYAIWNNLAHTFKVSGDTITNSLSNGVLTANDTSFIIEDCYFNYTGHLAGMGGSGNFKYTAIFNQGHYPIYRRNVIKNTGYTPIYWKGRQSLLEYNYIDSFGYIKDDGGGIYTYQGLGLPYFDTGSIIRYNIITNGIGAPTTTTTTINTQRYAEGIYLDDAVQGVTVTNNSVYKCASIGFFIKGEWHTLRGNTIYHGDGTAMLLSGNYIGTSFGLNVKSNIIYKPGNQYQSYNLFFVNPTTNDTESIDSNYYLFNVDVSGNKIAGNAGLTYTLSQWQAATPYDDNSHTNPTGITAAAPIFEYNPTLSTSFKGFTGTYLDHAGNAYHNGIVLQPFTSKILFKATTDIIPPNRLSNLKIKGVRQ